jgi:hypothetical protein
MPLHRREVIGLAIAAVICRFGYGLHTRYLQRRALFTAKTGGV